MTHEEDGHYEFEEEVELFGEAVGVDQPEKDLVEPD